MLRTGRMKAPPTREIAYCDLTEINTDELSIVRENANKNISFWQLYVRITIGIIRAMYQFR